MKIKFFEWSGYLFIKSFYTITVKHICISEYNIQRRNWRICSASRRNDEEKFYCIFHLRLFNVGYYDVSPTMKS
jgi:hypothetical protein